MIFDFIREILEGKKIDRSFSIVAQFWIPSVLYFAFVTNQ